MSQLLKGIRQMTYQPNKWNTWSCKSIDTSFISNTKCVGNGEEKLAKELDIVGPPGGQNNIVDLLHPIIGDISVKDMSKDDCILGVEGSQFMRRLFRKVVFPLLTWVEKYQSKCDYAKQIYDLLNTSYGRSRITIMEGIERCELSQSNFIKLNNIVEDIKLNYKLYKGVESLDNSEYILDICEYLGEESLQKKIDECVQTEATEMTLIIVDEKKGWYIVKDLSKISCPRITRGAPRIHIDL
jgi:hypothetical protein